MKPIEVCHEVLDDLDPRDYAVYLAARGEADTDALWLLYDEFRVMAPAEAWLHAARHFDGYDPPPDCDSESAK